MTIDQIIDETTKTATRLVDFTDEAQHRCDAIIKSAGSSNTQLPVAAPRKKRSALGKIGLFGAAIGAGWALVDDNSPLPKWLIMAGLGLMVADYYLQRKSQVTNTAALAPAASAPAYDPYAVINILQDTAKKVRSSWFDCVETNKKTLFAIIKASSAPSDKKLKAQEMLIYADKIYVDMGPTIQLLESAKDSSVALNGVNAAIEELRKAINTHSSDMIDKYEKIRGLID